eukprot:72775_1
MAGTLLSFLLVNHINGQPNATNVHKANNLSVPNSTLTYTTSPGSEYLNPWKMDHCNYYNNNSYLILPSQKIFNSIVVTNDTIEIQFDLKLNKYCHVSLCNIFYIYNKHSMIGSISLSINGIKSYFKISIANEFGYNDEYKIPNADALLPVDNQYHTIYLSYKYGLETLSQNKNVFIIDDSEYYYCSTNILSLPPNQVFELYVSSPYNNTVLNASVSNICIKSSIDKVDKTCPECIGEIKCGENITGTLLSSSDIAYYYLNVSQTVSILFDSCNSLYDTYLYLYDASFNVLFEGDDDGFCETTNREQLATPALDVGDYILGVSGCCEPTDHYYGEWSVQINCFDREDTKEFCTQNDNSHCWEQIDCCGDIIIDNNAIFVSWNSVLFVIDEHQIHYTNMTLFNNNYDWNHIIYNIQSIKWDIPPQYAQYRSSLYIYLFKKHENHILVHINLSDLSDIIFEAVPNIFNFSQDISAWNGDKYCIMTNGQNLYVLRAADWLIYNTYDHNWRVLSLDIPWIKLQDARAIFGCTIDRNYKNIYIQAVSSPPIVFNTYSEDITIIIPENIHMKSLYVGSIWSERSSFISAWNHKMYLHRCVLLQCDEIIFDVQSNVFTQHVTNIISASSELIFFDDNVILLKSTDFYDETSLYFTVTDMISMNFTNTISNQHTWPSDGFLIKYYLNDFWNSTNDTYHIWFYTHD